ncbi:2Fe-2S iron-sulfur cluster binding domain-containing protein [Marinobacterium sp. D7]|uniref:2Fe-2S iron-sulfur cluster-binding protein n=1 Tax=Marinobacterium ramblicola TaxID=2849041 RepID=UPI001C2D1D51|nr:2Fe-2S iron-sulfur cluster-binding protein [Marinobacterium ramblicola]MBV1787880.1 2Fe-2S iron-sulfur cluster binding domain-containing protein [Marinobacterium ramblicola]
MSAESWRVALPEDGLVLPLAADITLLEGLRDAGLALRHACCNGVCEICAAELLSGEVDQRYPQGRIRGAELNPPLIQLCTSKPRSDLILRLAPYARRRCDS